MTDVGWIMVAGFVIVLLFCWWCLGGSRPSKTSALTDAIRADLTDMKADKLLVTAEAAVGDPEAFCSLLTDNYRLKAPLPMPTFTRGQTTSYGPMTHRSYHRWDTFDIGPFNVPAASVKYHGYIEASIESTTCICAYCGHVWPGDSAAVNRGVCWDGWQGCGGSLL